MNGMDDFNKKCRLSLIAWYMQNNREQIPTYEETYVVWCCKALQNYKSLISTSMKDTIYAEFTYNGDSSVTYRDVYEKVSNTAIDEEEMEKYVNYYGEIKE